MLDHQAAAVIILTIEVRDKNAEEKIEEQFARGKCFLKIIDKHMYVKSTDIIK